MPILTHSSNRTVRQGPPWAVPWAIYFLAFVSAGAAAIWRGNSASEPSLGAHPSDATAVVRLREPNAPSGAQPTGPAITAVPGSATSALHAQRLAPDRIRQQIASLAGDPIRENLRIETAATSMPGELRISITMPRARQYEAAPAVNALAQAFATAYRTQWRSAAEQAYREVHETAGRAQQLVRDAKSRLDAMLDQQAQAAREAARSAAARRAPPNAASPAMIDNPDWVEQNHQLAELQQRRRGLLNERTPLHPAVQDIDNRIEQFERQLAAVPRQIPAGRSGAPPAPPAPPPVEEPANVTTSAVPTPSQAEIQQLQQTVEQAGRVHEDAIKAEQQSWQMRLQEPTIEVELASLQLESPPARSGVSALLAALAAGVTMVTGLGMISAAMAIEPTAATVAEIQAALRVPIVGVIPQLDPAAKASAKRSRRQRLLRMTLIITGLLILAGCLAMLVVMGGGGGEGLGIRD